MKTLAKIALIAIAFSTTACDQYLMTSGLGHADGQIAPPPPTCETSADGEVTPILSCHQPHKSSLVSP